MDAINIIELLATQHKAVLGFRSNLKQEAGAGQDKYPLVWVDDPRFGHKSSDKSRRETLNVDFLLIPKGGEKQVTEAQQKALSIALSFVEKINKHFHFFKSRVNSWNYITLRNYNDDDSAGVRFTFVFEDAIPANLCEEFFDEGKTLKIDDPFPNYSTDGAEGCAVFSKKEGLKDW